MTVSFDPRRRALPPARILGRGFSVAHGALLGVLWLFILQAPLQVICALMQVFQVQPAPGHRASPMQLLAALGVDVSAFVLVVAVFLTFPLVQGGILGQVRDGVEFPGRSRRSFASYARAYYDRLLGSQGIFLPAVLAIMLPVMAYAMSLTFDEMSKTVASDGGPTSTPQQLNRLILTNPGMLAGGVLAALLSSALWIVYWVANSILVADGQQVVTSWISALHFCGRNLAAVTSLWLLSLGVSILTAPLSLASQLGFVANPWALVVLAVVYSALIAYWGVLLAGLCMSLYLARRLAIEEPEMEVPVPT
jgi:hypothetical protein